ncbi:sugar phosphate isomerase/epimerase [Paenibacillus alkaliterrae]|uniref:sugar phosphate isomerase/epimerase family protein n=1 Tax=Paenibacillus alkaliterrae TaxID=320909 RepID=UPI001F3519A2|nr:TIM barrel protein [Paenibacillus alkaliterrae]MCF2937904.1 sugar phosphate isomerase/epimerase [Paenibacillus alkaliterrae]
MGLEFVLGLALAVILNQLKLGYFNHCTGNRFETYLINKLGDTKKLAEAVNLPSVNIMADLFHMNIEERDYSAALRHIAPYLAHVQIADNTREAARFGMTNFKEVVRKLIELGYNI